MKNIVLSMIVSGGLITSCSNQNISSDKIPSVVVNTLQAKYPAPADVDWKKVNNLFEADIDINDSIDAKVQIDEAGNLIMLKEEISLTALPSEVMNVINEQYKDYSIDDAEKLEKDGVVYYQVELNGKNKKDVNLVFTKEGKEERNVVYWD